MSELFKDPYGYLIPQIFLLSLLAILLSAPTDNAVSCGRDVKLLWLILFSTNALVIRLFSPSKLAVRSNKSSEWGFPRLLPNRSKSNNSLGMALFQELPNHFVPSSDCEATGFHYYHGSLAACFQGCHGGREREGWG